MNQLLDHCGAEMLNIHANATREMAQAPALSFGVVACIDPPCRAAGLSLRLNPKFKQAGFEIEGLTVYRAFAEVD